MIEPGAARDELTHPLRTLARADLHDHLVAEPGARLERVAHVRLDAIIGGEDGGDAPLGVLGVGLVRRPLGDDDDLTVRRRVEREGEAGNAAADDEKVGRDCHGREGSRLFARDDSAATSNAFRHSR
jgi:hypothetical protein